MKPSAPATSGFNYQSGFGNEFASEALPGALPQGRNSPQRCAYGLYAEQISGTAFTAPRAANRRSWVYRIRPAVVHGEFREHPHARLDAARAPGILTPNQLRWDPLPLPTGAVDFVDGLHPMAGNGSPEAFSGAAISLYAANRPMQDRYLSNADGEWLFVPQQGELQIDTEFGRLTVSPCEIAVVPRGVRFRVLLPQGTARGYLCENRGAPLRLTPTELRLLRSLAVQPGHVLLCGDLCRRAIGRSVWLTCSRP